MQSYLGDTNQLLNEFNFDNIDQLGSWNVNYS